VTLPFDHRQRRDVQPPRDRSRAPLPPLVDEPALDPQAPPKEGAAARVRIALALHRKGMLAKAKRILQDALALDPASGAAHAALGEILYVEGPREAGVPLLEQAIGEDPNLDRPTPFSASITTTDVTSRRRAACSTP